MPEMKAQELVVLASAGAVAGAIVESKVSIPVVSSVNVAGFKAGEIVLGAALAVAGWYWKMDGVSDFVEAFGIGYAVSAVI